MNKRFATLVLLALPFVHGCSCSGATRAMKKRPPQRIACGPVEAPGGAKWKSASVEIDIYSETHIASGRQLPIETTTWSVVPWLVLDGASGPARVPLAGGITNTWDEATLTKCADDAWKIAWAADGSGVACLEDGGDGWLWVACDGGRPFHCPHLRIGGPGEKDPTANGPHFEPMALEMMAAPAPKSLHPDGPDPDEWLALGDAIGVAGCPPRLLDALCVAALREHSGLDLRGVNPAALLALQNFVAAPRGETGFPESSSARETLTRKQTAGALVASNAAILLARSKDELDQRAMAEALLSEDFAPPATVLRDPQWPRTVAWSLGRSVEARAGAPEDVENTMLAFLKRAVDKPESGLPILFALAKHGSPGARKVLAAMAEECEEPTLPEWPASLDDLWRVGVVEHGALTHSLGAWAKAAR